MPYQISKWAAWSAGVVLATLATYWLSGPASVVQKPESRLGVRSQIKKGAGRPWRHVATLSGHMGQTRVRFASHDNVLISMGLEGKVILRDTATWRILATLDLAKRYHYVSPLGPHSTDGRWLAVEVRGAGSAAQKNDKAASDRVVVIATRDGKNRTVDGRSPRFSPTGKLLATARNDGTASLWELPTLKERARLRAGRKMQFNINQHMANSFAFTPDGRTVATATMDGIVIRLWDARTGRRIARFSGYMPTFSPDGANLAFATEVGAVKVIKVKTMQEIANLAGPHGRNLVLRFSADGRTLAAWAQHYGFLKGLPRPGERERPAKAQPIAIKLWECANWNARPTPSDITLGDYNWAELSPAGDILAYRIISADFQQYGELWDTNDGASLCKIQSMQTGFFAPTGARFLAITKQGQAELWDIHAGTVVARFNRAPVVGACFSANATSIAVASLGRGAPHGVMPEKATVDVWAK